MAKKTDSSAQEQQLFDAREELDKKFGTGTIIDPNNVPKVDVISSGLIMLDAVLGCGGFPKGRIVELFGEQSSGKSTIALATAAECLRNGQPVLYLDYEHSFSEEYAATFGIDAKSPLFNWSQPDSAEQGAEIVEYLLNKKLITLVVFDSVASMMTREELEADPDKITVASLARFMSREGKRLVPLADESGAVLLFVNHVHEKIGGFNPSGQPQKITPGGKKLKFYASLRVETAQIRQLRGKTMDLKTGKLTDGVIGTMHEAIVRKNKVAAPGHRANFIIREGWGLCEPQIVLEIAEARNMIKKAGPYYTIPGIDDKAQGVEAVLEAMKANPEIYNSLRARVKQELGKVTSSAAEEED